MDIKRAYRFRFYPASERAQHLARTFGCARFVYNTMLRLRTDAWQQRQQRLGYHESSAGLTALKKGAEHTWLKEVSSVPVQQALRHLQTAFSNFFAKRARYPTFRSKYGKQSAEYTTSAFKWDGTSLKLAKMAAPLDIRWSRTLPKGARLTTVTVSKDTAGRYHVSLLCDDAVAREGGTTACPDGRHAPGFPPPAVDSTDQRKPSDRSRKPGREQHAEKPAPGKGDRPGQLG
jgi:putative transposase